MRQIADDVRAFQARIQADLAQRREEFGPLPEEPTPATCWSCQGAGWMLDRRYDPDNQVPCELVPCDKCGSAPPPPEVIKRRVMASGMEHKRHVRFESVKPYDWQIEYWRLAMDYVVRPDGWLWLTGGWNTGKTTLTHCMGNEWLDLGKQVLFREVPAMLLELKHGNSRDAEISYYDMLNQVLNVPLLILDDYGKQVDTRWDIDCLFQITSYRLEHALPTVVTTNLSLEQLSEQQGRLFTRVIDAKRVTIVNFPDMDPEAPF